jgi:hypothetical protein
MLWVSVDNTKQLIDSKLISSLGFYGPCVLSLKRLGGMINNEKVCPGGYQYRRIFPKGINLALMSIFYYPARTIEPLFKNSFMVMDLDYAIGN